MLKRLPIFPALALTLVAGCAAIEAPTTASAPPPEVVAADPEARVAPQNAVTVEDFDTTTAAERAEAEVVAAPAGEALLGRTVASLGDPTLGGFWLETPLAAKPGPGRITSVATGKSVAVELRPLDAARSAGSRLSLAAMRLLEVPLTDLPELDVYGG
ncbi:hypothetical protein PSA7680_01223 [Pseudoruegeria aquimaris]|uniref:D-galactarate dehydratase n=1 Tax=Pseudoruegeria aquimaris TaxID=393663 RepID=A0A1Y5S1B1_9RHOB|nr:hypothetical protein [Pseudoruegeria aquimaris]SLN27389.1 hypothetical protein PSA7680_01223 [Pseudoruegeria aquimaris]